MVCMVNFARSRAGATPVSPKSRRSTNSSGDKASDIIQCDEFSHTACGRAFTYWLEQDGYLHPGACAAGGREHRLGHR